MKEKFFSKSNNRLVLIIGTCVMTILWIVCYSRIVNTFDIEYHTWVSQALMGDNGFGTEDIGYRHIFCYPLYHLTIGLLSKVLCGSYYLANIITLTACNIFSIFILNKILIRFINDNENSPWIDFASVTAMLFMPATNPLVEWTIYEKHCGPNPIHNPTITFVRPFGFLAIYYFILFLQDTKEKKNAILFSLFIFLSVIAKPSFAFTFLIAMGVVVLIYMLRDRSILLGVKSLVLVLPGVAMLLFQKEFTKTDLLLEPIHFKFGSFSDYSLGEVIIVSLIMFPVVLILFKKSNLKNSVYLLSIIALIIGWLQMFFLTDGPDGNMAWGYELAVQFATAVSLSMWSWTSKMKVFSRRNIAGIVYLYQCIVGVVYIIAVTVLLKFWF